MDDFCNFRLPLQQTGAEATYNFDEPICTSNTIINVYSVDPNTQKASNVVGTSTAILDGAGQIEYLVGFKSF